jgi:hypothetical protein
VRSAHPPTMVSRMPRLRHTLSLLIAVPILAACGGGSDEPSTSPSTQLKNADDVKATQSAKSSKTVKFGEFAEIEGFGRASVASASVGGDDLGPWLETKIRFENTSGEESSTPDVGIYCKGDSESGSYQADSTISLGEPIPDGSYKEGILNLLPYGFKRTGEVDEACQTPAFIRLTPAVYEDSAELPQIAIPDELVDELNAKLPK